MIQIIIPGVIPTVNHMYKDKWIRGVKYQVYTLEAENWKLLAETIAMKERWTAGWKRTEKQKVVVELFFYLPDKRKRDTHNGLKIILDSLQGILYDDDYYALPRIMDFEIDRKNPRIDIKCYLLN